MNYLGIDWGKSKVGIAFGSDEMKIATPALTLSYHGQNEIIKKLKELIAKDNIEKLVVGKPMSLKGAEDFMKEFIDFQKALESFEGIEVAYEDERLTTKYASVLQRDFRGNNKVSDDEIAAMAILQGYFDKLD
ncbi:Holliday junction resolvase RuvX [Patescibacteria group bacterium]|nr:Holliday junction resolvase RuvX [Patescibacteria group bacterium]